MSDIARYYTIIYRYACDIVNGKIKACKKHIQACKRFLDDLDKSQNEDYPYFFDYEELYKFYKWAGLFKHRAGVLKGQKIDLVPFQLFIVGNLFCWKHKDTGLRRFRKAYIQIARKNAKSQLLAVIASYECFLSKEQAEVYLAGWDKEQSSIVYREIKYQIESAELLKGKYTDSYGRITHLKSGSFIKPLSREAKNTGDGTNPSLGIVDEYHAHKTSEIYDVILSGMVAREQPLMVIITTAGFDLSRPCFKEYQYVSKILDPNNSVENEEYFVIVCELEPEDDIKDESNWIKANPIVATYENGLNYLRGELKAALDAPEKMRNFLTKNMNKWVDMKENGYMNMTKWSEAEEIFTLEKFIGMDCVMGMDLSTKLDLTSIAFEFCIDGIYYTYQHSFMPQETYEKRMREGKYRFDLWVEEGHLTIIEGAVIDYNAVRNYIKDVELEYKINILEICYDPAHATHFIQELEFEGYICVEVRQGALTLNEPTQDYRAKIYDGTMKHPKDGLYTWSASNAVCANPNRKQEYVMLDKARSSEKIDPMAATIDAHFRGMVVLDDGAGDIFYSPDI
ncbi:terminase large subunit [Clostridium botulinum]|uniref:terminase large subunit n=1 Tax=Clostridium botulinum TaxID=1491 RepID=UPI001C9B2E40|nr:terminase TerL endonuclease subunit [Clostridium botulinum]MBY6758646.1 terminase large subunit [Clostridium botulinum]MCR1166725.1 terminase large subunit [Clostridium botulinum]